MKTKGELKHLNNLKKLNEDLEREIQRLEEIKTEINSIKDITIKRKTGKITKGNLDVVSVACDEDIKKLKELKNLNLNSIKFIQLKGGLKK